MGGGKTLTGMVLERLPWALVVYFALHLTLRVLIGSGSGALETDEAEQFLLAQAFQWGYTAQPPLYTWLQHLLFQILGANIFAVGLLKNGLLLAAYLLMYLASRRLLGEERLAVLATLSWLLMASIAWEAQRDLSHSVAVLTLASASFYLIVRGLQRRGVAWYLVYGLVMGLGALSKYNFVIFAGALNLALLLTPEGRRLVFDWRLLLSIAVALAVVAPQAHWVFTHPELALGSLHKLEIAEGHPLYQGLGQALLAAAVLLTPLWLVYLVLFPRLYLGLSLWGSEPGAAGLLRRYLLVLALGVAAGVTLLGVGRISERWMLPYLFVFPAFFFLSARGRELPAARVRWFVRLAIASAALILVVTVARVLVGPRFGDLPNQSYPFAEIASTLETQGFAGGVIVAHNAHFAGNLARELPDSAVYVPGFLLPPPVGQTDRPLLIAWDARRSPGPPERVHRYVAERFGAEIGDRAHGLLTPFYRNSDRVSVRFGYILVPPGEWGMGVASTSGADH